MTLHLLLENASSRWGDKTFLLSSDGAEVTYREALARSNDLAWLLTDLGLRHGDRVAVILPNTAEMLYTWFALARLGAVMVPVNPALAVPEMQALLDQTGVCAMVGDAGAVAALGMGLRVHLVMPCAVPRRSGAPPARRRTAAEDVVTILQSSGTTGRPKAAALTHTSYLVPAGEFVSWMEVAPGDRFLGCLPLFHLAGQAFAVSALAGGAALALVARFSAHHFWEQVGHHGITVVRHLGEMLALLCRQPEPPGGQHRSTLRAVYGGGAHKDVIAEFERRFGVPVVEGYGLTETNTVLRNELHNRRLGSMGRPPSYCEVRIAGADGRTLPPLQEGEIQVKRNAVMTPGYIGPPELTALSFTGEWFRTGDLGRRDADGYFYFTGRQKDVVRRRGENISPGSIEKVLERHPLVASAAVIGVPDEVGGEEMKAYLLHGPGAPPDFEELVEWCRPLLADFEIPRYFELCAELPRTATNKIDKSRLRLASTVTGPGYDRKPQEVAAGRR